MSTNTDPTVFPGRSEMAALMREFDWEAAGLPPVDRWPPSLKAVVRILLTSRYAMWMGWGPDLRFMYNDAYRSMTLGKKHPWALGKPAASVWAEIWGDLKPRIDIVTGGGEATWDESLLLILERSGYPEESYHTFSYSPVIDDDGRIGGLLCVVAEDTERVIGERRLATLRDLAEALAGATAESEIFRAIERGLAGNAKDLPFTATYIFDHAAPNPAAVLRCSTGVADHPAVPPTLEAGDSFPWPVEELLRGSRAILVDNLQERVGELPGGGWSEPPRAAVVVPIAAQASDRPAGLFVAGLNRFRPFDADYAGFVELVAGQIGASIANARAYEAERRRAESLAELDRAKTTFFSNVSHEFRTPLTLMLGPAEDMLADPDANPRSRELASTLHRNALRLLKLVNTMLEFTRLEAGRIRARFEPMNLGAVTADLASSFRSAIEKAGLELIVRSDDPALGTPPVYVDPDMWERVVLNLLSNAFKHTFAGSIEVATGYTSDHALLRVRDTGVGIAPDELPRIFERFHRVPSARSRTHEGTGIGLALVQELVRAHGGPMTVASEVDAGTTFTVSIPLGRAHLSADQVADTAGERDGSRSAVAFVEEAMRWLPGGNAEAEDVAVVGAPPSVRGRVLVVDDNADMRDYVARLIRGRGHETMTAADGLSALATSRSDPPDVVLSDVMMPGLDGYGLIRALREDAATSHIPVVLLSARAGDEARIEGLAGGAADYLVKPFSARELLARVDAQIERARQADGERRASREQKLRLDLAERERSRLRELLEQAPAGIAIVSGPDLVFELANADYEKLINFRGALGRPLREVLPELEGQGIFEIFHEVRATGRPYVGHGRGVMMADEPGGPLREHFFNFVYAPIRDASGRVTSVFVHAVDVTQQMLAVREAEAANRAKSEFLAAMSHELRTPLNAIGGYAQLIEMGIHGPLTEPQRHALGRLRRSEHHLLSLVNDVLNFAKLEAGRVEYDIRPVWVDEIVDAVTPIVEPQLTTRGLTFETAVGNVPALLADSEKVQQILINLLSNAGKFTDRGGCVRVTAEHRDFTVAIAVSDTGIGIPADKHASIFDPFVQVNRNLTKNVDGTGLGLAISRDLARGMKGDLVVESAEGRGTTFTLTLPAA